MSRPARRVFGYARVSSEEQALGSSLRDQQASISAYAASLGLEVTKFFVEAASGIRAKEEKRVEMQALLAAVRKGDLVLCDKIDRWSRDAEFSYGSVRRILEAGASFYAVAEGCDPSTSEGDSSLSFRILFAREEHKRIKVRLVGTRRLLRDQGYYAEGPPPFGYRRQAGKGERSAVKNALVIVPREAALVRRLFQLCIGGKSISEMVHATGITKDSVCSMLACRTYAGQIENSKGEWIAGKWEPILAPDVFQRARIALQSRRYGGPRPSGAPSETDDWILRDVAVCGKCGAKCSSVYAGPHERRRYYYGCSHKCGVRWVPVRLVELAVEPLVVARLVELRDALGKSPKVVAPQVMDARRRTTLEQKRARYLEMYADGLLEREAMITKVAAVDADLARSAAPQGPVQSPKERREVLRQVERLEAAWRKADGKRRRAIVRILAQRVALQRDEPPVPVWRSAEDLGVSLP